MKELNERQRRFVDAYIQCGNASESVRRAGYKTNAADVTATKLMRNERVKREIQKRLDELHNERTADARECHELLTRILRGEEMEETALAVGNGNAARVERIKLPPKIKDKLKAAEILLRVQGAFRDKEEESTTPTEIKIVSFQGNCDDETFTE